MKRLVIVLEAILLSNVVDAANSGTEVHSIYACCGDSVRLFQNISNKVHGTETSLYKSNSLIAFWSVPNVPEQKDEKFAHDNYGNIWMHSIDVSDNATYTVLQSANHLNYNDIYEVRLIVLVAPEKSCRPQLNRAGDTLIVSLETGAACGNPEARVYWLDYPYLALESQAKAKLSPGREAGTYYACIETPALRCAGRFNLEDFCSSVTVDESNYHTSTKELMLISLVCILLLFVAVVINSLCLVQHIKKQRNPGARNQEQQGMIEKVSCYKPPI